jgi:class 3 adenylate cyclase/preprotein translocase subunit SecF
MQCPTCGHVNRAQYRFCAACGVQLPDAGSAGDARRCRSCGSASDNADKYCGTCGRPFVAPAPHRPAGAPLSYTPRHLAEQILGSRHALIGERKQVTVLFADVQGSMQLAEQLDPEDWHRVMDGFFAILTDGVHRYEGTVNQYTGDGIMALFGAPLALEDHAQRACHAALYLRDELRRYSDALRVERGLSFSVRMGLNSGEVVVGTIGDDLRMDYTALGHTVGLAARMEQLAEPGKALLTALSAPQANGSPQSDESKAARFSDSSKTLERLGGIPAASRTLDNNDWLNFLIFDNQNLIRKPLSAFYTDTTHAQIVVRLKGNASIDVEGQGSVLVQDAVAASDFQNATVTVTGAPVLLKQINDYLQGGMLQLGAIAVVVMTIILLLLFNVRWRLLPLFVILIGVIWAFGLAGYLGIPLSLVTIAGLPVMLGIGIDYAIQMHARVEEEVVIDHSEHPIQETARNLCPALLVVTFDAIFAFLALRFAKVPMIREFGLLLAVGIAVICLTSIVAPLAALGIREYKSPTKAKDYREGFLGRLTVWLGSLPLWAGPVLAVASFAVFFGGLAVEDKITLQSDPVQWVNQHSQAIKDFRTVEAQTGSSSELGIFVESDDVFSQPTIDYVSEMKSEYFGREVSSSAQRLNSL